MQREGKSLVIEVTLVASTGAGRSADAQATDARPVAEMPTATIIGVGSER